MKKAIKQSVLINLLNISSIVLLISIMVMFVLMYRSNKDVERANSDRFNLTENANIFINASDTLTNEVRGYAATGSQTHYDNYNKEANVEQNTTVGVQKMKEIGITDSELQMVEEMLALSDELIPFEEGAMADVQAGNMSEALDYVYGEEYEATLTKIDILKENFMEELNNRTQTEIEQLTTNNQVMQALILILIVLVSIMQVITLIVTRVKLLRPIAVIEQEMEDIANGNLTSEFTLEADTSEIGRLIYAIHNTRATLQLYIGDISKKLTQMAEGNLDLKVDTQYAGDFSPIQHALETILGSLNDTLGQINTSAEQVSVGASQVSNGAQALAAGSTEQASSVEELATSVEAVAKQAEDNSSNVVIANDYVGRAGAGVSAGNEHMEQLTQAMREIGSCSNEIVSITKTIEDIAFQTNILALNAAIEAARAGSAGKGFAVVADEVRSLAAKSAEAANQTAQLIEKSVNTVSKGTQITAQTAKILQEVGENAQKVTESFDKIEQATAEQTAAIEQIRLGLNQISSVVQTNAATAEENSATSEEMSAQSALLRDEVGKFKLTGTGGMMDISLF